MLKLKKEKNGMKYETKIEKRTTKYLVYKYIQQFYFNLFKKKKVIFYILLHTIK